MIRTNQLTHQFVQHIPERLQSGMLYISLEYGTAMHSCCCGCREKVVTPLTPTDWKMTFDGETVSLFPSIGNWALPCRSHYWIKRGKVFEAGQWTSEEIEAERSRDRAAKAKFFGTPSTVPVLSESEEKLPSMGSKGILHLITS